MQAHFEVLAIRAGDEPDTRVATIRVSGNGYNGTGPMVGTAVRSRRWPVVVVTGRLAGRRDLTALAVGLAVSTTGDAAALVALLLRLRPAGSG